MNDPLGLFEEEKSPDPLGLFSSEQPTGYEPAKQLEEKTQKYRKEAVGTPLGPMPGWLMGVNDLLSPDLPLGVIEQLPAAVQATAGSVAKGLGGAVGAIIPGMKAADTAQTWSDKVNNNPIIQAMTPETKGGQAITAGIGALFESLKDFSNDPKEMDFLAGAIIPGYDNLPKEEKTKIQAAISAGGNALPDLLMTKAAPHVIKSLNPLKSENKPAYTKSPKIEALEKLETEKKVGESQQPLFVDNKGDVMKELPTKINEDPAVTEQARLLQQQELERVAREAELPKGDQLDLFGEENLPNETNPAGTLTRRPEQIPMDYEFNKERPPTEDFIKQDQTELAYKQYEQTKRLESATQQLQERFQSRRPGKQSGVLNLDIFKDTFEQIKELSNGVQLIFKGGDEPSIRAVQDGKPIGTLQLMNENIRPENKASDNLSASWVQVEKTKQKAGVAREMYKFASEMGNDITSSKVQSDAGKAMWQGFEKAGMASNGVIRSPGGKQGGALDIKSIGEGVKKLASKLAPDIVKTLNVKAPKDAKEVLADGRLFKEQLKNYIPDDPKPGDIVKEALSQEDSSLKYNGAQSGATLTGITTGSAIIQGFARLYQNANKRAELAIRNYIQPVERQFKQITRSEVVELAELFKMESLNERLFSKDDLVKAGFNEKQIEIYDGFRKEQERVFNAQNTALEEQGRPAMTKRDAYLSSRWSGDWRVSVYENGRLVWYIAEASKARAENALEYLKANGVKVDKTSKVEYRGRGDRERGDVMDAYRTMLSVLDENDPRVAVVKSIAEDGMVNNAHSAFGQAKHFEDKAGIRGFTGDRPWKDKIQDAFEMFKEQFQYMKTAHAWTETQKAVQASKEVLSTPELLEKQPNNIRYAQDYAKNQLGFGDNKYVSALEGQIAEMLGHDRATFYHAVGNIKSLFLATKLGFFNTGYLIANLTQPLWTQSWHADLTSQGFKHNSLKTFILSGQDAAAGYLNHLTNNVNGRAMTPIGKEAFKYAEANGIVSRDIMDEAAGLGKNKVVEGLESVASLTMGQVEHVSRLQAFMGFVHHLEQSGKFKGNMEGLFQKAEDATNASMVDYRRGERPMVFDKMGLVGSAASALQTFKFNYYNQIHYFSQQAAKGNIKPLMTFMAIQLAIGGALSMPFLQEADDVLETIKGWLPDKFHEPIKNFGIKKFLVEKMDTWAYGGMSKITGANLSSRYDSGNLQDWSFDSLFPIFSDLGKQASAVGSFMGSPNESTFAKAAYGVTPPGPAQGNVETSMDAFKSGTTPEGNTIYKSPRRPEKQDADYVRTPTQEKYKKLGLTELEEAKYKDQRYRQQKDETEITKRMNSQAEKFFDAIVRKDVKDTTLYAQRYIEYGGNPENLKQIIESQVVRSRVPKETLDAMKMSTLGQIQKAQRAKEALNEFNH